MILRDAIVSSERHRLGVVETARPEPQPESLRPALTVSEVCAWLMGESEVTRRACASELAAELDQLRKAAELEPYWAQPHATIGRLLEKENPSAAIEAYERYLARAARNAPLRKEIEDRLAGLKRS